MEARGEVVVRKLKGFEARGGGEFLLRFRAQLQRPGVGR
jgi:hypothetical protein